MHLLTDGVDRGFGFEGILALARDARALRVLRLDGCFRSPKRSLAALAKGLTTLQEIGLAGCPRLHAKEFGDFQQGVQRLAREDLARVLRRLRDDDLVVNPRAARPA